MFAQQDQQLLELLNNKMNSNEVVIKIIGDYSYQTAHCLGEGVYGKVYEGQDKDTKEKVAIKKIDLNTFTNDKYLQNAIFSEIFLLKRFSHPNIVRFKDVLRSKNSLYIITEFCKHGDLKEIIKRKRFREDEAFEIVKQILLGFSQLFQEKIIHRDLKPANILVNDNVFKIADFGFAKYVDNFGSQMLKSCVGSPIYMAPQILERSPYTTKCDIWSVGVIFYEMLFGYPPWKARDEAQLLRGLRMIPVQQVIRRETSLTSKGAHFLRRCLAYNERDRADWTQLFETYLTKDKELVSQPIMQMEDSPIKVGDSGRNRFVSVNPLGAVGTGPVVRNGGNERREAPQSILHQQKNIMGVPQTPSYQQQHQQQQQQQQPVQFQPSIQPQRNSSGNPLQIASLIRQQCVFKHYLAVELYTNMQMLRDILGDTYRTERLVYALAASTRIKSSSCIMLITAYSKTSRSADELLRKMESEHATYQQFENDIMREFDRSQTLKKIRDQIGSLVIARNELASEEKISKLEKTLFRLLHEHTQNFCLEVQRKAGSLRTSIQPVQILDWSLQLLQVIANKDKIMDISIVKASEDFDATDYVTRTLTKVSISLSGI